MVYLCYLRILQYTLSYLISRCFPFLFTIIWGIVFSYFTMGRDVWQLSCFACVMSCFCEQAYFAELSMYQNHSLILIKIKIHQVVGANLTCQSNFQKLMLKPLFVQPIFFTFRIIDGCNIPSILGENKLLEWLLP